MINLPKYAVCMRCGKIHKYYRFKKEQLCYLLWCENCGTSMHKPSYIIGFIQLIKDWIFK